MASVFQFGSQAATATPAAGMQALINTAITSHPNWTLVDTVTTTVTAGTAKVYKCSGSGVNANSWGQDFYVATFVATGSPLALGFMMFEAYDTSTHLATRAVRTAGNATVAPPSGAGFVPDNTGVTIDAASGTNPLRNTLVMDATSTWLWAAHVSKSRLHFVMYSTGAPTTRLSAHFGCYTPNPRAVTGLATLAPLVYCLSSGSLVSGPGTAGASAVYFTRAAVSTTSAQTSGAFVPSSSLVVGVLNASGAIVDPIESTVRGSGVLVSGVLNPSNVGAAAYGAVRGSLPGAYNFFVIASGAPAAGDLVILSDGTRLALMSAPGGALLVNVDSDY